jgi:hypothetical protein
MFGEVALDGGLQIDQRVKTAATDALSGQHGEEVLDCVEPRAGGRVKWNVQRGCRSNQALTLVGGVVVDDGFDQLPAGTARLSPLSAQRRSGP